MKLFLSHSSRSKPLVREVIRHFPSHVAGWLDERELLIGDEVEMSLQRAIASSTDYVLLFVDSNFVRSSWVAKELRWALAEEGHRNRAILLPIVIDPEAWDQLEPQELKRRKYIPCGDFSEQAMRLLAERIVSELFALLSRELDYLRVKRPDDHLAALDEADQYLTAAAAEICRIVQPHRRHSPLPIRVLFDRLAVIPHLRINSERNFTALFSRLRQHALLAGIICAGDGVFVEEEHYAWKTTLHTELKARIASAALKFVSPNSVIVLDSGSTTLEIARGICRGLRMGSWHGLKVVTNSISAANELLTYASEMGLEDDHDLLQVFVTGGRIRCNTLAIVGEPHVPSSGADAFNDILKVFGGANVAFVGTNGVDHERGFTTHTDIERQTKAAMLRWAQKPIIVTDPSKLGIREVHTFAELTGAITILTTTDGTPRCSEQLTLIGRYFKVFDFVVDFYFDPSETPLGCVAVETTKGVPDGPRTTEHGC